MKPTETDDAHATVRAHIDRVTPQKRRRDAETLVALMEDVTGLPPQLWGTIVGFGAYHYEYESGHEGDAPAAAFAPRKAASVIYLPDGVGAHTAELERLGQHSSSVGCLYLKDLESIELDVLRTILATSYRTVTDGVFGTRARDST